jgi:hypothetical protein
MPDLTRLGLTADDDAGNQPASHNDAPQVPSPQPYIIQSRALYQCPHCGQPLKSVFRQSNDTSEWLLFLIALLLTPVLIGLIFWVIYFAKKKTDASMHYWHCESCGWSAATRAQTRRQIEIYKPTPLPLWGKIMLPSAICAVLGIIVWWRPPAEKPAPVQTQPAVVKKQNPAMLAKNSLADIQADYQKLLDGLFPHMNWIKVKCTGSSRKLKMIGYHPYFSQATFGFGSEAPAIGRWVSENNNRLKAVGIIRVGIHGTGAFSSGGHFDVQ